MKRFFTAMTIAIAITTSAAPTAHACSCMERPFEELAADADAIFEAQVASIEPEPEGSRVRVRLDVVQTWREANTEQVEVLTESYGGLCGVTFVVGRSYLVLAERVDGELVASLCGGTREMESASEERLALGSGVIPVDIEDGEAEEETTEPRSSQTLAPRGGCAGCSVGGGGSGGFAGLAGVLAWVAIRRRRIDRLVSDGPTVRAPSRSARPLPFGPSETSTPAIR